MTASVSSWLPVSVAVCAAAAGGAMSYWLAAGAAAVPAENRRYRDAPPPIFRALWQPIFWLGHYIGPLCTASYKSRVSARLARAGLGFAMEPQQFIAARCLLAAAAGSLAAFVISGWGRSPALGVSVAAAGAWLLPGSWLRDLGKRRTLRVLRDLPFTLDLLTLCVEGGLSLGNALELAADKCPPSPLREELLRLLRDLHAGKSRAQAFKDLASRLDEPGITVLVTAILQSESLGMSLGPILRAQAEQQRMARFARAEKLAMEAPVKMLLPLIACIFPCTFLVIGFPIAMKFLALGL
jgi:tight adherence protein C